MTYPLLALLAAFAVGAIAGYLCGWLAAMRFVTRCMIGQMEGLTRAVSDVLGLISTDTEVQRLKRLCDGLAARCVAQAEILSRRAEQANAVAAAEAVERRHQ